MSQRTRVLAALHRAGTQGISAPDFLAPGVVDGGAPILRLPSRVDELRRQGHRIVTRRGRNRCAVYVLEASPAPAATQDTAPIVETLDVPAACSPYDTTGDWA